MTNHPHDQKWIEGQLSMLPYQTRLVEEKAYSEAFEKSGHRRECNTRLRLAVDKVMEG